MTQKWSKWFMDGPKGGIWIDHSTTDYEQNKMFEEAASKNGGHILECPITGNITENVLPYSKKFLISVLISITNQPAYK